MNKRLSVNDVFNLGDSFFAEQVTKIFSPDQIMKISNGTLTSVELFIDNEWIRKFLSPTQLEKLQQYHFIDLAATPSKKKNRAAIYIRDYANRRKYISNENPEPYECLQNNRNKPILVLLVFQDTGELVPAWYKEWYFDND